MKQSLLLIILIFSSEIVTAQLMGRIMDRAKQKVERSIEEKIIEEVSEELARRAYRPVEKVIEDAVRQKYEDSLNNGESVDWDKMGDAYAAFLSGMNKAAIVPDKYDFDMTQEIEIIDYNKKRSFVKLHYSKKEPVLGMENTETDHARQLIVMDLNADIMVIFTTDKKGKKTGQAIPGFMSFSTTIGQSLANQEELQLKINKTGKTKKVAGFECEEMEAESKDELITMYLNKSFSKEYLKAYTAYLQRFAPPAYAENNKTVSGILLQSENIQKDDPDKKFHWNTKKISEKSFQIIKTDYTFTQLDQNRESGGEH